MEDLVVLYNGEIVYLSSVSEDTIFNPLNPDLLFFNNGRIRRFKKNGIAYMAIFDKDTNEFDSYRSEINFWNYNVRSASTNSSYTGYEMLGPRFNVLDVIPINVNQNSNVILAHEMIYPGSLDLGTNGIQIETIYRAIPYSVAIPLAKTIDLQTIPSISSYPILHSGTLNVSLTLTNYYNFIINKKLLNPNGLLRDLQNYEISILADIIQVFDFIFKQTVFINLLNTLGLIEPFIKSVDLVNRFNHDYGEIENKYHNLYTDEYFGRIRLGLIEFKYWLIQYSNDYSKVDENELIFEILNIFDSKELSYLSYDIKINILNKILLNNRRVINETVELAILKIIQSIAEEDLSVVSNQNDFNNFLDYLNTVFDIKNNLTLFEILYSNIDDNRTAAFTFGLINTKDNRKVLILLLYKIWKSSKYNPIYADPSYTQPANAFGVFPESYYMELTINSGSSIATTKYYNPITSPAFLCYESSSSGNNNYYLQTNDVNYTLGNLDGNKIKIYRKETTITTTQSTSEHNHFVQNNKELYGTYDLYQPISIIGFKPHLDLIETFKDLITGDNTQNPIPNIPVFLFYYLQDYSDIKKIDFGIMLGIEIALNLTGVGALSNLRYLNYLSKARSVYLGTATASETLLMWEAVSGVNALTQFTAGNLLALSNYTVATTADQDIKDFAEKIRTITGIITLGSLLTHPAMKRKLFDSAADVIAQESKLILEGKVHGLNPDAMNAIRNLYNIDELINLMQLKLNNLPSIANETVSVKFATFTNDEKYQFFSYFYNMQEVGKWIRMDFQYSRVVNGNLQQYTLLDIWKDEIQFLKNYRNFEFIDAFNTIIRDNRLLIHIHEGHAGVSTNLKPWVNGNHNIITIDNVVWRWENIANVQTNFRGYKYGKIERNFTNYGWSVNGSPWYPKSTKTTFWKTFSNDPILQTKRINEEMAYALSNKRFVENQTRGNNIVADIFQAHATDGQKIKIVFEHGTNNIKSIYPIFE